MANLTDRPDMTIAVYRGCEATTTTPHIHRRILGCCMALLIVIPNVPYIHMLKRSPMNSWALLEFTQVIIQLQWA